MYYMHQDGETLILMLYVDDLFITGSNDKLIAWLKRFLHIEFDITDLGKVQRYLGISFEQVILGTFLHQHDYTQSILYEFGMADCKPAPTPLPESNILTTDMSTPYIDSHYYCRLVGKLIFLTVTRPYIAYAVTRLSTHMARPQESYLDASKHVLHYLQGTSDFGILYRADSLPDIQMQIWAPALKQDDQWERIPSLWLVDRSPGNPNDKLQSLAPPPNRSTAPSATAPRKPCGFDDCSLNSSLFSTACVITTYSVFISSYPAL